MWLPQWLTLGMFIIGVHPQYISYMEMLLSDTEAVHRVPQDSSHGIQKIKINTEERGVTVLPLSIDSNYGMDSANSGPVHNQARDTLSKRQATSSERKPATTPKQANAAKTNDSRKPTNQKPASEPKPPKSTEQSSPIENKPNPKVEPKTNKYGIGNTLVLLVQGNDPKPSYVDQTQPHKVAEPLRYEPKVGPARVENNRAKDTEKESPRPEPLSDYQVQPMKVQYNGYDPDHVVPQPAPFVETFEEPRREPPRPVYENPPSQHEKVNKERYDPPPRYEEPDYKRSPPVRVERYDEIERPESRNPSRIEDSYVRNPPKKVVDDYVVVSTPNRNPVYEDPVREEPKRIYNSDDVSYTPERRPVRPAYEEPKARPSYEDTPTYIELRPASNKKKGPAANVDNSEYAGFPESFQLNRNPGVSRPLQYEPPRVFPASPCLSVFQYEGREPGDDYWNGDIYVTTEETLIGVRLDIILDRPARLLANWLAEAKTRDNIQYTILSLNKRLVPGPAETVKITVRFPPDGAVPYLKSIILNGRRICPVNKVTLPQKEPTRRPVFENPGDFVTPPTTEPYRETQRPPREPIYEERPRPTTERIPIDRRPTTEAYQPPRRTTPPYPQERPDPNPNYYEETGQNRVPTQRPKPPPSAPKPPQENIPCGKPAVQPRPLVTHGAITNRGQWPWHAAIYKNVGVDLSYICGGSLISTKHVVTAAHCVTSDFKPVDPSVLVVYLGKYHLRLWSEGGVQNKQVKEVHIHESYNKTAYRADLAVLVLSSPVEFTEYIRPVCLWDRSKTDIAEVENKVGVVVGWGFDESKQLTEELMQAHMPIVKHDECLWSYPEFFPKFTSNLTYCAGFRNGTSVCNGDSGGGMVFPMKRGDDERWYLRGLVSISVAEKDNRVCDTRHFVVFTDLAQFLPWLEKFV